MLLHLLFEFFNTFFYKDCERESKLLLFYYYDLKLIYTLPTFVTFFCHFNK